MASNSIQYGCKKCPNKANAADEKAARLISDVMPNEKEETEHEKN